MKKLILLALTLSLCFMIGCKEAKEPIKEIENAEVPKIEVPITEPKIEEPIEETPIEPKVEEPKVEEPEVEEPVEELDENVIILPEPDENTRVIKIEFPEDFPLEPYTEPELVSPEEFEWGGSSFIVEYAPVLNLWYECYPQKALLKEGITSLEEGVIAYNKEHGIESQDKINVWSNEANEGLPYYITQDFQNANLKNVANNKGLQFFYVTQEEGFDVWYAFSEEENKIVYKFLLQNSDWTQMDIFQLTDSGKLLLSLYKQNMDFRGVSAYTYSLEKEELTYIKSFAHHPIISKDEKHLAYTSPHLDEWDMVSGGNNLDKMKKGFYIEEIKTGKTVFYPDEQGYNLVVK